MINDKLNILKDILCKDEPSLYHVCSLFILHMEDWPTQDWPEYLRVFLDQITLTDLTKSKTESYVQFADIPQEDFNELSSLKNRVISNLIRSNVPEIQFYQTICEKLTDSSLIPTPKGQAIFLQLLWLDRRIPYFHLDDGVAMDNEKYKSIIDKIQPTIDKGYFILNTHLQYKTQRSSLLLNLADSLENEDERIVFWAVLLSRLLQREQILLSQAKDSPE